VFTAPTALPEDPATLQQILRAALAEIERLRLMIAALQRNRFGRRSEQLGDAAFQQGVEELEQSLAEQTAKLDAVASPPQAPASNPAARPPRTEPAKRNRGALPAELPRLEQVIDIENKTCPCCGGALHVIGEDRTEMLDYVPAQFRVRVTRRPRGACPCEGGGLPLLRGSRGTGAGSRAPDRRRHGDRGTARARPGQQIQRSFAAVSQMLRSTFAIKCCTADYVAETRAVP
jgi:hypothetical protein